MPLPAIVLLVVAFGIVVASHTFTTSARCSSRWVDVRLSDTYVRPPDTSGGIVENSRPPAIATRAVDASE